MDNMTKQDIELLLKKYDSYPDPEELLDTTERDIRTSMETVRTLLDATETNHCIRGRIKDPNRHK